MKTIANKEILVAADFAGCALKNVVKDALNEYLWKKTKRSPMILPIIMEV